jgi:hypothetical protein
MNRFSHTLLFLKETEAANGAHMPAQCKLPPKPNNKAVTITLQWFY